MRPMPSPRASAGATTSATTRIGTRSRRAHNHTATVPPLTPPYQTQPLEESRKPIGSTTKDFHPAGGNGGRGDVLPLSGRERKDAKQPHGTDRHRNQADPLRQRKPPCHHRIAADELNG